jgi:hypothetical protein
MSIRTVWVEHVRCGALIKLNFLLPGRAEKRVILLSSEMNAMISGPWKNKEAEIRCTRLRADLENILAGNPIVVCWEPHKAKSHHQIGRLDPPEDDVFDIRSVDPSPGLRVIFHFVEKDVLVLHVCNPRSVAVSWMRALPLGGKASKAWKKAIRDSKSRWSTLFPQHPPHHGIDIHAYLSNAVLI